MEMTRGRQSQRPLDKAVPLLKKLMTVSAQPTFASIDERQAIIARSRPATPPQQTTEGLGVSLVTYMEFLSSE